MEFRVKHDYFKAHLYDKLYGAGLKSVEKRTAFGKLLDSGFGAYAESSHTLRPGELHDLGRILTNHSELKKIGWTPRDTKYVTSALGEHFAPQSHEQPLHTNDNEPPAHTSHTVPPATNDNDVAPVRQIV